MKKLLSLGVVSLFIGVTAMTLSGGQVRGEKDHTGENRSGNEGIRERFTGAWRLAWLEEQDADGKVHRADCTGLLVYTRDRHVSVQVMYRNPPANPQNATNATAVQYAQGGYESSFGTCEVDDALTGLSSTLRAHWCGPLSAKTCRAHSSSRANSSL